MELVAFKAQRHREREREDHLVLEQPASSAPESIPSAGGVRRFSFFFSRLHVFTDVNLLTVSALSPGEALTPPVRLGCCLEMNLHALYIFSIRFLFRSVCRK
jgi:hypothetical protein